MLRAAIVFPFFVKFPRGSNRDVTTLLTWRLHTNHADRLPSKDKINACLFQDSRGISIHWPNVIKAVNRILGQAIKIAEIGTSKA